MKFATPTAVLSLLLASTAANTAPVRLLEQLGNLEIRLAQVLLRHRALELGEHRRSSRRRRSATSGRG